MPFYKPRQPFQPPQLSPKSAPALEFHLLLGDGRRIKLISSAAAGAYSLSITVGYASLSLLKALRSFVLRAVSAGNSSLLA
jgi:hypothetical protein